MTENTLRVCSRSCVSGEAYKNLKSGHIFLTKGQISVKIELNLKFGIQDRCTTFHLIKYFLILTLTDTHKQKCVIIKRRILPSSSNNIYKYFFKM